MTPEQEVAVIREAESWLNTPYHPHARIKGSGVDCAMLLAEVYSRAGLIPNPDVGYYSPQFYLHKSEEVFKEFVEKYATEIEAPRPGCCAIFKFGHCFSHGAIMLNDKELIHASAPVGFVCKGRITDAELSRRKVLFYTVGDR